MKDKPKASAAGLIRLTDVLSRVPISKSCWWIGVKNGRYPQPVRIGARIVAWRLRDIETLCENGISTAESTR
jgi:prophage regulatory protein